MDDSVLRRIHEKYGNVPLAVNKDFVVGEDELYLYVDTGMTPDEFAELSREAAERWKE